MNNPVVYVIIATSMQRTNLLINRSLSSVYSQKNIDPEKIKVIVVDDNPVSVCGHSEEFNKIDKKIGLLRESFGLSVNQFETTLTPNSRTRGNSGTGAWNTGIYMAFKENKESYISILDDDDEYYDHHLHDCIAAINSNPDFLAVFQRMDWINEDGTIMEQPLIRHKLTPESFFIGNPGVQGSNMFFKTKAIVETGAFNEEYPNTTDRDLMIRFLWYVEKNHTEDLIGIVESTGVNHFNHAGEKVNNDLRRKQAGLDMFYCEYKSFFSTEAYRLSVERAERFFKYQTH